MHLRTMSCSRCNNMSKPFSVTHFLCSRGEDCKKKHRRDRVLTVLVRGVVLLRRTDNIWQLLLQIPVPADYSTIH